MISYAQNFEDVMLWRCFEDVQDGFYIDLGAFDPEFHSVTQAFYSSGWRGINVEPNPNRYKLFEASRTRDINIQAAIGNGSASATLYVPDNEGLASLYENIVEGHKKKFGYEYRNIEVDLRPLSRVWAEHVPAGQDVHFLKIDVEGHEKSVVESNDWENCRPWIVVIESTAPMSEKETHSDWAHLITQADYECVYFDGLNRFYVAQEKSELGGCLRLPPNVFDAFTSSELIQSQEIAATTLEELKQRTRDAQANAERAARAESDANEAQKKSVDAEQRATDAEQRATDAEQKATDAEQRATDAEQKTTDAEQRATEAEQRATEAEQVAAEISKVYDSYSWKITWPLRAIGLMFILSTRKALRALRQISMAIKGAATKPLLILIRFTLKHPRLAGRLNKVIAKIPALHTRLVRLNSSTQPTAKLQASVPNAIVDARASLNARALRIQADLERHMKNLDQNSDTPK